MNNVQSLQKRPQVPAEQQGDLTHAAAPTPINPNLMTCSSCDAVLDNQQRYCLNCGTRSRYASNPAIDYVAENRRRRNPLNQAPVDDGIAGTGVTKRALPWLAGSTVIALVAGLLIGSSGGNNDEALLAALANQKPVVVAGAAGPSTATAAAPLTSDFTLDKGYTVQVATIPSTSDQAAADAAKSDATGKGAEDVGLINPADFTLDPADPSGNYVIYSGQFEKKKDAEAALKKLKAKFPDAKVLGVTSTSADTGDAELTEELKDSPLGGEVSKEKVAKDKKAVEELDGKTGEEFVEGQDELPDAIVNEGPTGAAGP